MSERMERARALLPVCEVDALLVWNLSNVRYLSGFTGTEGCLVIGASRAFFLSDSRYATQAEDQVDGFDIRIGSDKIKNIAAALGDLGATRVGFEDETLPVARLKAVEDAANGAKFSGVGKRVDALRLRKDPEEIAVMRRAAWAAEVGFKAALAMTRPGVTENELALELEMGMRRAGATKPSFDLIVASGPRGALPHGIASDRRLEDGDMVVFDFGCVLEGYCSDQTVTVALGNVGEEERKVYEIVREAQERALDALRPGVALKDVDHAARDYIDKAGYGAYFGHGLGHGVGLEIHEDPRLSRVSEFVAEPGMVVTVEPGIYLPERFGVRIEDTVVITESGYDKLTSIDKNWMTV
ncbi:MAG: Xaa-Pro peptidase family protein [Deltaproteobacteria bacterium]|nr:Xaa-Pro peptidase family protein [Deltaproteobacteria bacterium]